MNKRNYFILLVLLTVTVLVGTSAQSMLRCVALDVDEGQAVLLQRGNKAILVDTGHFGQAKKVKEALRGYGVEKVEAIVLTHLHPDHATGVFAVLEAHPEAVVYEAGHRLGFHPMMDGYRWVAEQLDSGDWQVETLRSGDTIGWRAAKIEVLWPEQISGDNLNRFSLVLQVTYGTDTVLIMGDVDLPVEQELVARKILPRDVEVLVVGHHGAADATGSDLLDWVSPEHAVISINADNLRGYPDAAVVQRLREYGVQVHQTYLHGDFIYQMTER